MLRLIGSPRDVARGKQWLRDWQLWSLPGPLLGYLLGLVAFWAAATGYGLLTATFSVGQGMTFLLLVGCGAVAVEASRRQGEPAGVLAKDLLSAWWLPMAFVLPPVYSLLAPVPLMAMTQFRVRRSPTHRRVFSVAAIGLANAFGSFAFHSLSRIWSTRDLQPGIDALLWAGVALLCAVVTTEVNSTLVAVAVKASSPDETWRGLLLVADSLILDWGELCTGVVLAILCQLHPLLALIALGPVLLLQRGLLHDQLSAAARLDAKTGLLNAPTWEREAASEIARAQRTGTPLCVMLLDLDHFKRVNDEHGHVAGDAVLKSVAEVLRAQLREYDLSARFGGDEFAVLLPQSDLAEAKRTAERIRVHISALAIASGHVTVQTTVSIGIAHLSSPHEGITELLVAADSSLYQAKANGRHRIWAEGA